MEIIPRPYQQECVNIINSLDKGSYMVVMATGLGKTVVMSLIQRKGRVLILSHRDELVHQPIKYFNCTCGIEKAENHSNGEEVVSASVQSMVRRLNKFSPTDFDMIITDEAHHAVAKSYQKIYNHFKPRLHIGFTATPRRFDKVRLDRTFSKIIYEKDLKWGIENKYLCDIQCYQANIGFNMKNVQKRQNDFVESSLSKEVDNPVYNKRVAEAYETYAKGQTLIFCVSIHHAKEIASLIPGAVALSSETSLEERKRIIQAFTERKIPCIVNCMLFTEGTDLPLVETIIIARPTMNQSLYSQMCGRGVRLHPDKKCLTLIDCVGVSGNLRICTAPTLYGLLPEVVPQKSRKKIVGKLSEMESIFEQLIDCPSNWILQAEKINLFSDDVLDYRDINWRYKQDGSLWCCIGNHESLFISPCNELGLTKLHRTNNYTGEITGETGFIGQQKAIDLAFNYLVRKCLEYEYIWEKSRSRYWRNKKCSPKQLEYIQTLIDKVAQKTDKYDFSEIDIKSLSRYQAFLLIDRLVQETHVQLKQK